MNTNRLVLIITLHILTIIPGIRGFAQCGVTPALSSEVGFGSMIMNIHAGASVFDPGWEAYAWEWKLNNSVVSVDSMISPNASIFYPDGFNLVCLKISATNPGTGDSCTQEICNVFQSTGAIDFVKLDVSVNGMDVNAESSSLGYGGGNVIISWGDGTYDNSSFGFHTYASPGEYAICADYSSGGSFSSTCRKVQVANGNTTSVVNRFSAGPYEGCTPFTIYAPSTIPPFYSGNFYLIDYSYDYLSEYYNNGSNIQLPTMPQVPRIPGQAVVFSNMMMNNTNEEIFDYERIYFDVCGIAPDTLYGYVFNDTDADGIFDPGETGIANEEVHLFSGNISTPSNYSAVTDSNGYYSILAPKSLISLRIVEPPAQITLPPNGIYSSINSMSTNVFGPYNFGSAPLTTIISGLTYLDFNQDSVYTSNPDDLLNSATIIAYNNVNGLSYGRSTYPNGSYSFSLPSGNYSLTAKTLSIDSAYSTPDTIFVNSSGGIFAGKNFGFYSPVQQNIGVKISGFQLPQPGFQTGNIIKVTNNGIDTTQGTVVFTYPSVYTVDSIFPVNGVINTSNNTVTWPPDIVGPASTNSFKVFYVLPPSVPIGTVLTYTAHVTPDVGYTDSDTSNNSDSNNAIVIGSFDPNDKQVEPPGLGPNGEVVHNQKLSYKIRFQNTGTAPALNVFVQDEIDADLDLNTLVMENASHQYSLIISGNTLTMKFMNINLPDSNANEPGSHGYFEYSILPIQGLPDGTQIHNTAGIYFDFNAPVITNTTLNTLQTTPSSINELSQDVIIKVVPIPAKEIITILSGNVFNEYVSIQIEDISGRSVQSVYDGFFSGTFNMKVDISGLSNGMYMVNVNSRKSTFRTKFIKN